MAKTYIADELANYIYTKINSRGNLTGVNTLKSYNCGAIADDFRPTHIKNMSYRTSDSEQGHVTNYIMVLRGDESAVPVDSDLQFRTYSTEILVHWNSEAGLKLAEEEIRAVMNDWELNGRTTNVWTFVASGCDPYKYITHFHINYQGKENSSISIAFKSLMEARPA